MIVQVVKDEDISKMKEEMEQDLNNRSDDIDTSRFTSDFDVLQQKFISALSSSNQIEELIKLEEEYK